MATVTGDGFGFGAVFVAAGFKVKSGLSGIVRNDAKRAS